MTEASSIQVMHNTSPVAVMWEIIIIVWFNVSD